MNKEEKKKLINDMFPNLSEKELDYLSGLDEDFSVIVTRVLDKNTAPLKVPTYCFSSLKRRIQNIEHEYNYPELFTESEIAYLHRDINKLREESSKCMEKSLYYGHLAKTHKIKCSRIYYGVESDRFREESIRINKDAATEILKKSLSNSKTMIDLHGLFLQEALDFIEDYIKYYDQKEFKLITGREYNSKQLRPNIIKFLEKKGYLAMDNGPVLEIIKNKKAGK